MARPLKVGVFLPIVETQMAGVTPRWTDVQAMARTAEDVGLDSVWIPDHLYFQYPGVTESTYECTAMLAALAAVTERVEIGTLVICTGFRYPAVLASMANTIDEISNGRLILGLGAGYHEPEYRAFGIPYDHRYSRFEEALHIIATLAARAEDRLRGQILLRARVRVPHRRPAPERPADHGRHDGREDAPPHREVRRYLEPLPRHHQQQRERDPAPARGGGRGLRRGWARSRHARPDSLGARGLHQPPRCVRPPPTAHSPPRRRLSARRRRWRRNCAPSRTRASRICKSGPRRAPSKASNGSAPSLRHWIRDRTTGGTVLITGGTGFRAPFGQHVIRRLQTCATNGGRNEERQGAGRGARRGGVGEGGAHPRLAARSALRGRR